MRVLDIPYSLPLVFLRVVERGGTCFVEATEDNSAHIRRVPGKTPGLPESSRIMSSPKYQPLVAFFRFLFFCRLNDRAPVVRQPRGRTPLVYEIPPKPSRQLKVVIDYFNFLKLWDLEALSQLSTPYFTQVTLPASLGVPVRNKTENIEFLRSFRDSLMCSPLEVCSIQTLFIPELTS